MMRHIATIESIPLRRDSTVSPLGTYSLDVELDEIVLANDPDKTGFVRKTIAAHLAKCVFETGIPTGEGYWTVVTEPWLQLRFPGIQAAFKV